MRLPNDVREVALAYAYKEFDHRRWEQVPTRDRGAVFDELLADRGFGGLLRPYMTEAQIRVWLKDSVAKEYPRALEGIGGNAAFTLRRYPGPAAIAEATLGSGWVVVAGSIEQKPMTCVLRGPQGEFATLLWGPLRGLRDLYWAASRLRALSMAQVAIVITRPNMTPLPSDEWASAEALCELIGVRVFSVMYVPRATRP